MNNLEKAEVIASIPHIQRFLNLPPHSATLRDLQNSDLQYGSSGHGWQKNNNYNNKNAGNCKALSVSHKRKNCSECVRI